jgi:2-amino-4-hydroxy-6-hydroxymethyldihydropteridine diphosphokinase
VSNRTVAYVALGSNLGLRRRWIRKGLRWIAAQPRLALIRVSSVWETIAEGPPQPNYFNAVAEVHTALGPENTLEILLAAEDRLGRLRRGGGQARRIDLDLLLWGDAVIDSPNCIVPHPRMHTRAFVLAPLSELAPQLLHPRIGRSISELLQEVGNDGLIRREAAWGYNLPRH